MDHDQIYIDNRELIKSILKFMSQTLINLG